MSVPPKRRTSSSARRRRSHDALDKVYLGKCPECGKSIKPHKACTSCGAYKGRKVLKIKVKKAKSK